MTLPEWAERAFKTCRPQPHRYTLDGEPDPAALAQWAAYTDRFRARWSELDADRWKIDAGKDRQHVSYCVLLAALESSRCLSVGASPTRVVEARRDMLRIDEQIAEAAECLAGLFRQREQLGRDYGVTRWAARGLDAIDLWDAVELAFSRPVNGRSGSMNSEVFDQLQPALTMARTTSQHVPQWVDVLEQLAERFETATEVPDVATWAGNTNKSEFSPWCNTLIVTLHDWGLGDQLTLQQLADLACVAFDAKPGEIGQRRMGELRAARLRELT